MIYLSILIIGIIYKTSCRTNQREVVMLTIRKIEKQIAAALDSDDRKFWEDELRHENKVYLKINGWESLNSIYAKTKQ